MTYKELLRRLAQLSQQELAQDATIYHIDSDKYLPVDDMYATSDSNVLDKGHVIITVEH